MKQVAIGITGAALGAFIPCASYQLSRHECGTYPWLWILVAGGFLFSSFTVFDWAKTAFGHSVKAFGFVILTEGVLVLCHTEWLSIGGLIILAALNATATASNLLRDRTEDVTSETSGGITTLGIGGYIQTPEKQPEKRPKRRKRSSSTERVQRFRERQKAARENSAVTPISEIRPATSSGSVM